MAIGRNEENIALRAAYFGALTGVSVANTFIRIAEQSARSKTPVPACRRDWR
jgi:hypothetical protein